MTRATDPLSAWERRAELLKARRYTDAAGSPAAARIERAVNRQVVRELRVHLGGLVKDSQFAETLCWRYGGDPSDPLYHEAVAALARHDRKIGDTVRLIARLEA